MSIGEKFELIADAVYEVGKQDGDLAYFNMLTNNGKRTQYYGAFAMADFSGYTFPYLIQPTEYGCGRIFWNYPGTSLPGNIDFTKIVEDSNGYYQNFMYAINVKEIVFNAPAPKAYVQTFDYCAKMERLIGVNVAETTTFNRGFLNCYALRELTMFGTLGQTVSFAQSPLNKASIENIIDILSSTASGKTLTLKLSAVQKAFETSEGANDGNTSEEWMTLAASKSNWTITLSS
jgi:hypothetical protein